MDVESRCALERYLSLVRKRASGELITTATWIRKYVSEHPAYKHDSVVSQEINFDLLKTLEKIQEGKIKAPELLGDFFG